MGDGGAALVFEDLESSVRTYCRRFPVVFTRARGHTMWDEDDREYVDFLSGAGALNYGHNHPAIKQAIVDYLDADGPVHALDLYTTAKAEFLCSLNDVVLRPRGLSYRVLFTGPTGTNAIEAAFKVARRVTGRTNIIAFTNGFHGLSLGALAASSTRFKRAAAGVPLTHVTRMPYAGYLGPDVDTIAYLERFLDDPGSGIDEPAAVVVETVQGEGGLASASPTWLQALRRVTRERGILLAVDDIQAGCGRTGRFFSFEESGIAPDIISLSKSISGYGLPMALTLVRPEFDQLGPGEHSGTFRGHNLAFVAASAALRLWTDTAFENGLQRTAAVLDQGLRAMVGRLNGIGPHLRGRGMLRGLSFATPDLANRVSAAAFEAGLLVETSGAEGRVVKIMPPIVIEHDALQHGLDLLEAGITHVARDA